MGLILNSKLTVKGTRPTTHSSLAAMDSKEKFNRLPLQTIITYDYKEFPRNSHEQIKGIIARPLVFNERGITIDILNELRCREPDECAHIEFNKDASNF